MIIAIASKRGPKVEAVQQILPRISYHLSADPASIDYLTYEIDAGIKMPRTLSELLTGAEDRVKLLKQLLQQENRHADFYIGMEGGFHRVAYGGKDLVFLQSWAYVSSGKIGYYGSSGNVLVPDRIALEVMEKNRDLSIVIDEATQTFDVRSKQGTWGVLTKDFLTRQQSFEIALTAAFAPFYNKEMYK
jgi:inosine/xanthosine triphosphatase